jgi:hypothetical protein
MDRRRHRVFVTRNSEYHLRNDECVGVRDRSTGAWLRDHVALRLRALRVPPIGLDYAWIGQSLTFWGQDSDVVTSTVVAVGRPAPDSLLAYTSLVRSGEIVAA